MGREKDTSSIFTSTFEPNDLTKFPVRILIEAHTTNSVKTLITDRGGSQSFNTEHSLVTLTTSNSPIPSFWDIGSAILVELFYKGITSALDLADTKSKELSLQIDGIIYLAFNLGERKDRFGNWDWTVSVPAVPIEIAERTELCRARISGREILIPEEFRRVGVEEYWEGRRKMLLEFNR